MNRRRLLLGGVAGGLALAAGALEAASFGGRFDHRRPSGAEGLPRRARYRASLDRLDEEGGVVHIGHSTHILGLRGARLLTDPWFYDPAFGGLVHAPAVAPEDIGRVDAILVSHDHPDHADVVAMDRLDKRATVLAATSELAARIRSRGFSTVTVLTEGESVAIAGARITAVPARHDVREVGYVVEAAGRALYFAGDTRYFDELAAIGERFALDLAILPVDGTRVRGAGVHVMSPEDAVRAARLLRARMVMPSHADAVFGDPVTHLLATTTAGAASAFAAAMARDLPAVPCAVPAKGALVTLV